MNNFVMILVGIGVGVAGGFIGLVREMYCTVAFIAGFASVACIRAYFNDLAQQFSTITRPENAKILSFLILAIVPLVAVGYLGRKLLVLLGIAGGAGGEGGISPTINAVLGAGYAITVYIIALYIL